MYRHDNFALVPSGALLLRRGDAAYACLPFAWRARAGQRNGGSVGRTALEGGAGGVYVRLV